MEITIKTLVAALRRNGEIIVDCGNGWRTVELERYKNATEAALAAMDCAKCAPWSGDGDAPAAWQDRLIFTAAE